MGGKSSMDDAMDAIVAVLRTEFVNTRCGKCRGDDSGTVGRKMDE